MSGFKENNWNHFLNGGTSSYNFSYQTENDKHVYPIQNTGVPNIVTKVPEKVIVPSIKGGKRKSRRATKKSRRTHKK